MPPLLQDDEEPPAATPSLPPPPGASPSLPPPPGASPSLPPQPEPKTSPSRGSGTPFLLSRAPALDETYSPCPRPLEPLHVPKPHLFLFYFSLLRSRWWCSSPVEAPSQSQRWNRRDGSDGCCRCCGWRLPLRHGWRFPARCRGQPPRRPFFAHRRFPARCRGQPPRRPFFAHWRFPAGHGWQFPSQGFPWRPSPQGQLPSQGHGRCSWETHP